MFACCLSVLKNFGDEKKDGPEIEFSTCKMSLGFIFKHFDRVYK